MKADSDRIRILVVDDHPLLRDGVAMLIGRQSDMEIVGEANDGIEAIVRYRELLPDVTLMDFQMPRMDGTEAVAAIRSEFADAKVVMLTTYKGDMQAFRAFSAGVSGYILKDTLRKDLVATIRAVHAGKRSVPPELAADLATHLLDDRLSPREIEVLQHVAIGNSNKAVGSQLDISEDTVKAHMRSILSKLKAKDRTHAVTIALKRGIIAL